MPTPTCGMQNDLRPDRTAWTVFEGATDRPVMLDDLVLVGLDRAPKTSRRPLFG